MKEKSQRTDSLEHVAFTTRAAWRRWLLRNHARASRVWLRFYRKSSGRKSLSYDGAVEEALCFGWIDSVVKSLDAESYVQLFTPRKAKSAWSKSNKERIERLTTQGLMTEAGLERVETAKRNGSWHALDSVEALEVPPDLARALSRNRRAKENFERFSPSRKKQVLYRINSARRPETRQRRVELAVQLAAENRSE